MTNDAFVDFTRDEALSALAEIDEVVTRLDAGEDLRFSPAESAALRSLGEKLRRLLLTPHPEAPNGLAP